MNEMKAFTSGHRPVFVLFAALLLTLGPIRAAAQAVDQLPKLVDYVSDDAHVLSPQAIARIDQICTQLDHSKANAQIAVVTVKTLDGDDAADYASRLEEKWKIGKKGTDRGVLILLAVNDHKRRIDVGYGLEGILPDGKVGDIGREMVPYLRANDFDDAVMIAVGQLGQVIAADANVTLDDQPGFQPQQAQRGNMRPAHRGSPLGGLVLLIILLVFFGGSWIFRLLFGWGLLNMLVGGGNRGSFMGGGGGWGGGFGGGGFGGGGGDGGGSGFGGFGGGSFGGGGAGGDW